MRSIELTEWYEYQLTIGSELCRKKNRNFEFYTSRLGIGQERYYPLLQPKNCRTPMWKVENASLFHQYRIKDTAYYWNELFKCLRVSKIEKIAPEVDSLNIGGGFPIEILLDYDYEYMANEIVYQIKNCCEEEG